ncbi:hypothetical protein PIB30_035595 [Stylosanthes scabra]|uniref:Uncharacterized protein n=1 Tax=Stylosanthes scabra TaxID=79078 RepID=A0ABU6WDC1_9FABA|nr:hypothetical protein [Stylosanthes scabra]
MGGASHAMKRIPRIKFPQRHPKSSGSASAGQGSSAGGDAGLAFFSGSKASVPAGGKASLQPKRTPVSKEEIEAVLLGGCFMLCVILEYNSWYWYRVVGRKGNSILVKQVLLPKNPFFSILSSSASYHRQKANSMDDGPGKINFIPDYFQVPTSVAKSSENRTPSITESGTDKYLRYYFLVEKEKKR